MVQLTDEISDRLDRESAERGCSRSAIIREAVADYLDRSSMERDVAAYVDAYRRLPQGASDRWGALDDDVKNDGQALARTLDAEDAGAGFSWDDHA